MISITTFIIIIIIINALEQNNKTTFSNWRSVNSVIPIQQVKSLARCSTFFA